MRIIRTRQRPFMVIVDFILTVLAWIGLLYLIVQGLLPLLDGRAAPRIELSLFDALDTLQTYLWVALFNAAVLIGWARYQQRKSKSYARRRLGAPVVGDDGLSRSFKLSSDNFARMRQPGTMIVHNDDDGGVIRVETCFVPLQPGEQPPALAPLAYPHVIRLPSEDDPRP